MPDLYAAGDPARVRAPAFREWASGVEARTAKARSGEPKDWNLLGHGLMLLGPPGTGKSSCAALAGRAAANRGRTVRWAYVPTLVDRLTAGSKERIAEIQAQKSADLLIWDDFAVRDLAAWEIGYLDQIVEERYQARRPMVVTANWTAEDFAGDERLARLVDRWRERTCSSIIILTGESMRKTT